MAQFDPDDSLLGVLRTPDSGDVQKANRREFIPHVSRGEASTPKIYISPDQEDWKERFTLTFVLFRIGFYSEFIFCRKVDSYYFLL